ncbi:MAG: hypothetical protein M0P19_12195 [Nevskia sp.]|jgi:hypothetical protein|nr:hypothetical protein [Nevskia sp.]MCK9383214.1 hypothetical protein [Nevskia sp.]
MPAATRRWFGVATAVVLATTLSACSLFSQTPDPGLQQRVRANLPYGTSTADAESKLSGLGFACSKRQGNYLDESGHTRNAEHFLFCEERPGAISFTCLNRNQVTAVLKNGVVSAIEVTRGPSCSKP